MRHGEQLNDDAVLSVYGGHTGTGVRLHLDNDMDVVTLKASIATWT